MDKRLKYILGISAIISGVVLISKANKQEKNLTQSKEETDVKKAEKSENLVKDFICLLVKNV
ncbi:MAG: hypothetical protein IJ150_03690 [Bacteroidales bacterium]|nr:hypothetical protein [Bacteroidales bacterium]